MNRTFLLAILIMPSFAKAQSNLNIVPMPAEVYFKKENFILTVGTQLNWGNKDIDTTGIILGEYISGLLGYPVSSSKQLRFGRKNMIHLETIPGDSSERYTISINSNQVLISGGKKGVFYGVQTFMQLLSSQVKKSTSKEHQLSIPQLSIKDYPRFIYRGMHLDVARHFMPVSFVKKYIDYLAAYKFNTFHWHLTDDQGWRIEIKKYPKLTEIGAWRNGTIIGRYPGKGNDSLHYGGFYTQEEIKEVVKYAAERYITIIPEIEMPGHASAAIAAYPQLSCFPDEDTKHPEDCVWAGTTKGKQVQQTWGVFEDVFSPGDYTFNFLQDVLDEVMALFPSEYIHVGGDESPKEAWKRSAFCQQLIKDKGLKDEHGLQSYFIQRIEKYINSKGRKIIGWDEILEGGLAPNATVMSWRGEEGGIAAAKQNHDVIMTPGGWCYLDHTQTKKEDSVTIGGYTPLEKVYNYEPVPASLNAEQAKHVLGAQGNVWTEYMKYPSKVEYMIFPRLAALAEVLWAPKEKKDWKSFERRLPVIFNQLDKEGISYSKAYYDIDAKVLPVPNNKGVLWSLSSKMKRRIMADTGSMKIFEYKKPVLVTKNISAIASLEKTKGMYVAQDFYFNKATGKKVTLAYPPSGKYPGNGAFTLVDGVQNKKGLSKSSEFIGFEGKDCEAVIDFGKTENINKIIVHALQQKGIWIWRPLTVEVFSSANGKDFTSLGLTGDFTGIDNGTMTVNFNTASTRYIKVFIKNRGPVPAGEPGAGNSAWLFVDEIEVE